MSIGAEVLEVQEGLMPTYGRPAIVIIERNGDVESIKEFATIEDYSFYTQSSDTCCNKECVISDLKSHGPIYKEIKNAIKQATTKHLPNSG